MTSRHIITYYTNAKGNITGLTLFPAAVCFLELGSLLPDPYLQTATYTESFSTG